MNKYFSCGGETSQRTIKISLITLSSFDTAKTHSGFGGAV